MYSILHLETSHLYHTLIRDICNDLEIEYTAAESSDEALQILAEKEISLILSAMEHKSGTAEEFIIKLNASSYANIPIVLITGNDSFEDRKRMYDLGIIDYIIKKADPEDIRESLKAYKTTPYNEVSISNLNIAVLDDSKLDRKITERIFRMNNITRVDFYESPNDMFSSGRMYDIYLIDIVLQNKSGHQVIQQLRKRGSESVIIAISGIDNVKTVSQILSIGADDYITKPYNNDLFMARLKTQARSYSLFQQVKEKTRELEIMAVTDGLTSLYNHKYIFELLDKEIEKSRRYNQPLSLVIFDLDHFKKMNDNYGHPFGDAVLKKVSEIIKKSIRSVDYAGRYGGEEFMVILPQTGQDRAYEVSERIRIKISHIKASHPDFSITISGGCAQFRGEKNMDYIKTVDELLYRAKTNGRNNIQKAD